MTKRIGKRIDSRDDARAVLAAALRDKSDAQLLCRDPGVRHPWEVVVDFHVIEMQQERGRTVTAIGRDLICGRCDTVKREHFIVGRYGLEKIGTWYDYPESYRIPGVPRGVKPSEIVHQENYRRAMERVAAESRYSGKG